jgi:hypothetical protein
MQRISMLDHIARTCDRDLDERALSVELLAAIRARVPCSHAVELPDPDEPVDKAGV